MESTLQDVFLAKEHTVSVGMNSTFQMFLNALNGVERILYDKGSVWRDILNKFHCTKILV